MKLNQTENVFVVDNEGTIRQFSGIPIASDKKGQRDHIWDDEMHLITGPVKSSILKNDRISATICITAETKREK